MLGVRRSVLTCAVAACVSSAASALAHNSWVVASVTRMDVPGTVRLAFVTGHDEFPSGEAATQPERIAWWDVISGDMVTPVTGYAIEGTELVARHDLTEPGLHVVAASLHPRFIELAGEKFTSYLWDEGAIEVLRQRRESGTESQPGLEYYTKFGKTYVQVGPINPGVFSYLDPVGHRLEIIPLSNPAGWQVGDTVRVRVLSEGEPIAELPIASGHESSKAHDYEESVFTDADGVAEFTIDKPGHWFIRTHTIGPAVDGLPAIGLTQPGDEPEDPRLADWDSYWASITVEVGE
ncbi:MAG: DUF4198 domain-containing protein [Planctomycetota bacterium]